VTTCASNGSTRTCWSRSCPPRLPAWRRSPPAGAARVAGALRSGRESFDSGQNGRPHWSVTWAGSAPVEKGVGPFKY
jgi:hypothetical protein